MKKLSQQLFAAVAAVLGFAGLASAQSAPPYQQYAGFSIPSIMPQTKADPGSPAQSVPVQAVQQAPVQPVQQVQVPPVTQLPPVPPAAPAPGPAACSSCGRTPPGPYLPTKTAFGAGLAPVPYAEYCGQCANGCGSFKSDCGFVFGSCKSFFNPCGPLPCNGLGGCCRLGGKCPAYPYGKPYGMGYNTCVYDSYLMH